MNSILVVDDMAVFREPIAASLRLAGYDTLCAADGEEALRLTLEKHPQLILLDVSMPKMDGITFLKHLRANPTVAKTPVILLTALAEKKHIVSAAQFGVKDYLLKSRFRLQELLERVQKFEPKSSAVEAAAPAEPSPKPIKAAPSSAQAPAEIPQLLTQNELLQKVEDVFQAETLSGVIAQVIAIASSPRSEMADLAGVIIRDPVLSARVLQIANSASYSIGAVVTTIPNAIRKIGYAAIRNVAAALGVFDCMPEAGPDGFNPIRCWQHSFAVAKICEQLASAYLPERSGLAYLVGLCHDLGDIFIRTQFSNQHQQVAETAARTGRSKDDLHLQMLGMTTAQITAAVLKRVGLPSEICEPINVHHSPGAAQSKLPLAGILWMAENYANAALLASSPNSEVAPLTQIFCRNVVGAQNPSKPDPINLRSEIQSLTVALARLSRADEAKLLAPIFEPSKAKVWIVQTPRISAFAPIGLAVSTLTEATIHNRLPTLIEMEQFDGIVFIGHAPDATMDDAALRTLLKVPPGTCPIPALLIAAEQSSTAGQADSVAWHTSVALSQVSAFAQSLQKNRRSKAA